MQENKDAAGFLGPLANTADRLIAIDLPGETAGMRRKHSPPLPVKWDAIRCRTLTGRCTGVCRLFTSGRILICGSLYLVGEVLVRNYP